MIIVQAEIGFPLWLDSTSKALSCLGIDGQWTFVCAGLWEKHIPRNASALCTKYHYDNSQSLTSSTDDLVGSQKCKF